ncbi:MAG: heptaprenyl diphosphate synthase [Spirochaetales bacterium]|nr:MAG: heptaprenyl diphosphate synthase [Spirochaetales bacterium]
MKKKSTRPLSKQEELTALLAAFALFLSTIEYLIPKPVPFFRLGLANLPVLLSLSLLTPGLYFLLVFLKIAGQGLVNGTLFSYSFLFSAAGSFASGLAMYGLWRALKGRLSYIGISMAGALSSNVVQLFLARFLVVGSGMWVIGPPFLVIGLVTSILLGIFSESFIARSTWYKSLSL